MSDTTHRAFFGDRERDFVLTAELIAELERTTGAGIGRILSRLNSGDYFHKDLVEIIRLALIGGGEHPERAATLSACYAAARPLGEVFPLAMMILARLWMGPEKVEPEPEPEPAAVSHEISPAIHEAAVTGDLSAAINAVMDGAAS